MNRRLSHPRPGRILVPLFLIVTLASTAFTAPGDPRLDRRASQALREGRVTLAVELFERWTEAMPDDAVGWYNYACALSLAGSEEKALRALGHAFEAGYADSAFAAADPDLASLRGHQDFDSLLARMGGRRQLLQAGEGRRHSLARAQMGQYDIYLPDGYDPEDKRRYPLVVMLHGAGGNETGPRAVMNMMDLEGVIVAIPRAPYHEPGTTAGYRYWGADVQADPGSERTAETWDQVNDWHEAVIEDVSDRYRVDRRRVVIEGFSQGAAAALMSGLRDPGLYCGVIVVGGFLPAGYAHADNVQQLARRDVRVLVQHGEYDGAVGVNHASDLVQWLRGQGAEADFKRYQARHEITAEMARDMAGWIRERVAQ